VAGRRSGCRGGWFLGARLVWWCGYVAGSMFVPRARRMDVGDEVDGIAVVEVAAGELGSAGRTASAQAAWARGVGCDEGDRVGAVTAGGGAPRRGGGCGVHAGTGDGGRLPGMVMPVQPGLRLVRAAGLVWTITAGGRPARFTVRVRKRGESSPRPKNAALHHEGVADSGYHRGPVAGAVECRRRQTAEVVPVSLGTSVQWSAYDASRGVAYPRPRMRGLLHHASFDITLVLGTLLVVSARGSLATAAVATYAGSVCGMFGVSALYHRVAWRPCVRRWLQRLDHAVIFLLIAGTYTPVLLLKTPRPFGAALLGVVWGLALTGVVVRMVWLDAPERLVGAVYLGLGWLGVIALPVLWPRVGFVGVCLIVAGGVLYTLGALVYHRRWPDPTPAVFGFHEVFHAFVCAAVACHYVAIAFFVA
jgi:hemolysin III